MILLNLLLPLPDYQPLLPKLEAYLAKEHRLKLSSIFFQFNSAHKDDHLVYRFRRAEPSPLALEIRTNFYEQPIVKSQLDQGYSVPFDPAPFTVPGAAYTETPKQMIEEASVRLLLQNSVANFMFFSGSRPPHPANSGAEVDSQLKELESIAERYVKEESTVFLPLKQAGTVTDIRFAHK